MPVKHHRQQVLPEQQILAVVVAVAQLPQEQLVAQV
jgi:hypothetical protein